MAIYKAILPSAYQQVEYIESSGTQYIDSGVTITNTIKLEANLQFTQLGANANENIVCSNGNYGTQSFLILTTGTNMLFFGSSTGVATNLSISTKYKLEISKTLINVNGAQTAVNDTSSGTLYLMYAPNRGCYAKHYSHKIYDNGTLVRNFIPCYRKSDSVIGLYDTVYGVFYTNAGTGTFTKGNDKLTKIATIYKGADEIVAKYKGTQLFFSAYTWEELYTQFIYNALVPETINGKTVKNDAKLGTIYGNGVVENQLVQNGNFVDFSNWATSGGSTVYSVDNNTLTFKAVQRYGGVRQTIDIVGGHKYLFTWNIKMGTTPASSGTTVVATLTNVSPQESRAELNTNWQKLSLLTTANSGQTQSILYIRDFAESDWADNQTRNVVLFDLTLMFGTGNEPTTLTDTRIQALLNRGYISYNTGTYKGTDIGVISSEPYNLLSLDRVAGNAGDWNYTNKRNFKENEYYLGFSVNNYYSPSNISGFSFTQTGCKFTTSATSYGVGFPIIALPNTQYILSFSPNYTSYVGFYDNEGNFISYTSVSNGTSFTTPSNCYWVNCVIRPTGDNASVEIEYSDICLHRVGTRTGYAPYQTLTPIQFKYQGNGAINTHDTFEITNSAYVFTRNVGIQKLKDLTWTTYGTGMFLGSAIDNFDKTNLNNLTPLTSVLKYQYNKSGAASSGNLQADQWVVNSYNNTARPIFKTSDYVDATSFANHFTNNEIVAFPLAAPQVISIPKKHLGVVDLGSLEWSTKTNNLNKWYATISNHKYPTDKTGYMPNIYCCKYPTSIARLDSPSQGNKTISYDYYRHVCIEDSSLNGKTKDEVKQSLSGVYLFYETDTEVEDINTKIGIESGGTLTTNWFSWKKNQLVNYSYGRTITASGISITNNNDGSFTISGTATAYSDIWFVLDSTQQMYSNHKYLLFSGISGGSNSSGSDKMGIRSDAHTSTNMDIGNGSIGSPSSNTSRVIILFTCANGFNMGTGQTIKPTLIDLTVGFGSGNEPTSINDPRIQYIINQGYIPTDTTGTDTLVDSQVLPNIDLRLKSK